MTIKVYLTIGYDSMREGEITIPDEDLAGLSGMAREDLIYDYIQDWANNYIEYGYAEIK